MGSERLRPGLGITVAALAFAVLLASAPAFAGEGGGQPAGIPQEAGNVTRFVEGSTAAQWGVKGEAAELELEGDADEVRISFPPEALEKPRISEARIYTRVMAYIYGGASIPMKGHVGDDSVSPDRFPSYRRGWNASGAAGFQAGFDAGIAGFFVDIGYQSFKSKGQTTYSTGGWYRYSSIHIMTLTPGFKIQFQDWMKYLYAGDSKWDVNWFNHLLHSFPYVKFGVGPTMIERLEVSTDLTTKVDYWERGLSYTFFFLVGLEWRPFNRSFSFLIEGGFQAFVFTTETAYSRSPDWLTASPIRLGFAFSF